MHYISTINQLIKPIAESLEAAMNINHIVVPRQSNGMYSVPTFTKAEITYEKNDVEAFALKPAAIVSFEDVMGYIHLLRVVIPSSILDAAEGGDLDVVKSKMISIMKAMTWQFYHKHGVRSETVTYGSTRGTFAIPGRNDEYLLFLTEGGNYELRLYANFTVGNP